MKRLPDQGYKITSILQRVLKESLPEVADKEEAKKPVYKSAKPTKPKKPAITYPSATTAKKSIATLLSSYHSACSKPDVSHIMSYFDGELDRYFNKRKVPRSYVQNILTQAFASYPMRKHTEKGVPRIEKLTDGLYRVESDYVYEKCSSRYRYTSEGTNVYKMRYDGKGWKIIEMYSQNSSKAKRYALNPTPPPVTGKPHISKPSPSKAPGSPKPGVKESAPPGRKSVASSSKSGTSSSNKKATASTTKKTNPPKSTSSNKATTEPGVVGSATKKPETPQKPKKDVPEVATGKSDTATPPKVMAPQPPEPKKA